LALVGKETLRVSRRAHVTAGNLIRVNHPLFDQTVGDPIRPGASRRADQVARRLHRSVRAAIEEKVDMVRHDGTVFLDARFDLDDRGVARIAGSQFFSVVHHHLDCLAALLRQKVGDGHVHEPTLAAEIAADVHRMKDQLFFGDADAVR
jgi:hypothetical protein